MVCQKASPFCPWVCAAGSDPMAPGCEPFTNLALALRGCSGAKCTCECSGDPSTCDAGADADSSGSGGSGGVSSGSG
jgi:hypothetical protein